MAKIVWIASYPKSGNTWVRFLIAHLLKGGIESSAEVEALVPDAHKPINAAILRTDSLVFIKTHDLYTPQMALHAETVGVIYVLRNPLDVIASNLNYLRLRPDFLRADAAARAALEANYVATFIATGGDPRWRALGRGGWSEHVASWLGRNVPFPRLVVRYKDLKADPAGFLARACRFVGLDRSEEEIARAVAECSFAGMRAMEEREIAAQKPGFFLDEHRDASGADAPRFLNRGEIGGYRAVLTEEQIAVAMARFGPLMAQLGLDRA